MKKTILKFTALGLFVASVAAAPLNLRAQETTTNAPALHKHASHDHPVFNGKLTAVDKDAETLKVGERTFEINSETKITKAGKPATLSDGVVGEPVAGVYKKSDDGKMTATSIRFGAKPDGEKKKKKKTSPDTTGTTGTTTNSVPN